MDYIKGELSLDNVLLATWPPSGEVSCPFLVLDSPFLVLVREGSLSVHPTFSSPMPSGKLLGLYTSRLDSYAGM